MNISSQSQQTPASWLRIIRRLQSDLRSARDNVGSLKAYDRNLEIWRTNTELVLSQMQEQLDNVEVGGGGVSQEDFTLLGGRVTTAEGNIAAAGGAITALQTLVDNVSQSIDSTQIKNSLDTCHIKVVDSNTLELKANGTVMGKVYQPIGQATTPLGVYTNDKLQFTSGLGSYSFTRHGAQVVQPGLNVLGVYINQTEDFTKNQISQLSISNGQTLSLSTGHLNAGTGMMYYSSLSNTNEGPQQSLMLSGGTPQTDPTINLYSTQFASTLGTSIPIQFTGKAGYKSNVLIDQGDQFTSKSFTDFTYYSKATRLNAIATPTANLSMNNYKITLLANPTVATDAANKSYVDSSAGSVRGDIYWDVTGALIERGFTQSLQAGTDFGYMKGLLNEIDARNTSVSTTLSSLATTNTTQNNRLTAIETKNTEQDTTVATLNTSVTTLGTRVTTLENAGTGVTQTQLNNMIYASQYLQRYCGPTLAYIQYQNSGISYTIWGGLKYMLPVNLLSVSHMTVGLSGNIVAAASDNISINMQSILDKLTVQAVADYLGYSSLSYRLQYDTTVTLRGNSGGGTPTTICVPAYSSYNGVLQNTNSTPYNSNLTGGKPFESIMNASPQTTTVERAKDTGLIDNNLLCYHAVGIHNTSDTSYILRQYKVDIRISLVPELQNV